ncbi:MAG: hypothetical protein LBO09_06430 [Candidatus Peribacteria bacterium]|nr:hypothetical protein [Candidatus Peribacteria bacterium]
MDAEFFIPVEINFLDPQHITSHVVENIQKTPTIDLCHLAFWTIERTKVLSPQKEEFSYYLNTELTAQDIEFKNGGEIGEKKQQTLAGILHFKQQVKEKIQQHAELSQKICTAYCEVLKFLLDHTTLDINALTESMTKLGYPSDVIQEHLAQLQALPPLRVQKQKNIAQDTLLLLKEKDTLTFANAYKDQGAQLYQNVLK